MVRQSVHNGGQFLLPPAPLYRHFCWKLLLHESIDNLQPLIDGKIINRYWRSFVALCSTGCNIEWTFCSAIYIYLRCFRRCTQHIALMAVHIDVFVNVLTLCSIFYGMYFSRFEIDQPLHRHMLETKFVSLPFTETKFISSNGSNIMGWIYSR